MTILKTAMMYRFLTFITTFFISLSLLAQSDPKAKEILEQLSTKTKSYSTIKADFNYTLDNVADDIHETQSGTIATKGDKYFLQIAGQEIRSNGKTVWTYLKDAEEVQISEVDEDSEDLITPTSIFTMYEKGFRQQYIGEKSIGGVNTIVIHIFPLDLDQKSYHTVKLYINKSKMEISKVEIMGKEGETYTYTIKSFQPNVSLSDDYFSFNTASYPDVEVVDLR